MGSGENRSCGSGKSESGIFSCGVGFVGSSTSGQQGAGADESDEMESKH